MATIGWNEEIDAVDEPPLRTAPDIDEDQEAEVSLEGEAEAPAEEGEGESAVIRDFRKREREKDRELRELRAKVSTPPVQLPGDPGPEPTEEDFNYDVDRWKEALRKWHEDKHTFEGAQNAVKQHAEQIETNRRQAYQAAKTAQPIAGIEEAEKRVFDQVPEMMKNALLHAKSPALVAVLDKYPDRMNAIAEKMTTDPAEALMMIGELRGKAKIVPKTRTAPNPERIVTGTASMASGGDKREEALAKGAQKDPSKVNEYLAYMRAKRRAAKA